MSAAKREENRQVALILTNTLGTNVVYPTGVILTNSTPMHVSVVDGSGTQITSFGGGTQYAELITTSPGTGTLALGRYKSSAPTLTDGQIYALQLDASGNLKTTTTLTPTSDTAPATQNITVVDSGSSTATGANNQSLITGSPTASSAASFSVSSLETVRVQVTGTWTGTLSSESSIDGGTTWISLGVHQGAYTTSTFTASFVGGANVSGATNYRIRATAAITGTAVVKVIESVNAASVYVANAAPSGNVISILNSSAATLTSGSIFTGVGEDVSNFSEMRVSVFSNVASASDGLSLQQSTDNTNWDITDIYTISAATGKTFVVPRQARYFRAVYTNGGTNQASFRLQTILNRTATAPSSQRPNDAYTNETDLVQGQSFLMGFNGTTWDRVRTVINATNSIGTGIMAVGVLAQFDDVSPTAITENQFGNIRMSANRNAYGTIRDAAGNERGANVTAANALSVDGSAVTQPTAEVAPTTVLNGKKTVTTAGTRVVLASSTVAKSVTIKALTANTGTIYVGDSSVSASNGYALAAGDSVSLDIANLTTVNIDSSVNGEGVTYLGVN